MNKQVWNTGKVKIGIYDAPKVQQDTDADLLQRALLDSDKKTSWDSVILVACSVGFVFMFVADLAGWLPGGRA